MSQIPIAARGGVLYRGLPLDAPAVYSHLDHPRFREYLDRWNGRGENFLLYVVADSGLHYTFETSRISLLTERLDILFSEFAQRKSVCAFKFFAEPHIHQQLTAKADMHFAHSLEFSLALYEHQDIRIDKVQSPIYGPVLFATIPREMIEQRDTARFLLFMDSLACDLDAIESNWMQLRLNFSGWDVDLRHFHEIPAIKSYMQLVIAATSWWLALVHPSEYVKWFGVLTRPRIVKSKSGRVSFKFKSEVLLPISRMAVYEAVHMLDSSEIEQGATRDDLVTNLRMAVHQLEIGTDLIKCDPLARTAMTK